MQSQNDENDWNGNVAWRKPTILSLQKAIATIGILPSCSSVFLQLIAKLSTPEASLTYIFWNWYLPPFSDKTKLLQQFSIQVSNHPIIRVIYPHLKSWFSLLNISRLGFGAMAWFGRKNLNIWNIILGSERKGKNGLIRGFSLGPVRAPRHENTGTAYLIFFTNTTQSSY